MLLDEDLHRRARGLLSRVPRVQRDLGIWELPNEAGGFHIWPRGQGEGEENYESAEEPAPVEAVAVET